MMNERESHSLCSFLFSCLENLRPALCLLKYLNNIKESVTLLQYLHIHLIYRIMKNLISIVILTISLCACTQHRSPAVEWISTTADSLFVSHPGIFMSEFVDSADVEILLDNPMQEIDRFGACFNELGWTSLSELNSEDRENIIKDLFSKDGMNFSVGRMPLGANDFSRDWYSYNETDKDFEMENFSIANDEETLIPFIKAALAVRPDLRLWASPWCPPTWMKYNKHYACMYQDPETVQENMKQLGISNSITTVNHLTPDQQGAEGADMFIQKPEYLKAYALYFKKFIEAYRSKGIRIEMVAPQNEFNSCQVFPSCIWTAESLSRFVGTYLGPEMQKLGVKILFGTMERKNDLMIDTVMKSEAGKYVSAIGFQWAGKGAIKAVHEKYPELKLVQTESECGDGKNSWDYCFYTWNLMKHYLSNGTSVYMYWNISLEEDGLSHWFWRQNSLVSVDKDTKTYRYTPEYYLMKQLSHFVQPGARRIETSGRYDNLLAFRNPDNSIVVIAANEENFEQPLKVRIGKFILPVNLESRSINTFVIPKK